MKKIGRLAAIVIGAAGLCGVVAATGSAENPQVPLQTGISGSVDTGVGNGDVSGAATKDDGRDGAPAGEVEKTGVIKNEAGTTDDGPSIKPGFHEWTDGWKDCEKKEKLERLFREQMERQHQ